MSSFRKVGEERLSDPVEASPYVVTYSEVSMTVGVFQLLLSFYIFARAVMVSMRMLFLIPSAMYCSSPVSFTAESKLRG